MEVVSDERVRSYLSPERAYQAVRDSFQDLAEGQAVNEPRHRTHLAEGTFNVMWAVSDRLDAIALKAYPVVRSDVRRAAGIHISLYSQSTGHLASIVRGDVLGQIRTGAASAVAVDLMANRNPETLTIFGTGFQAQGQLDALLNRFPSIHNVFIIGRQRTVAETLASTAAGRFPGRSIVTASAEDAVRNSDLVVTATASSEPLFDGDWLRPGTHVSAVGSNHAEAREVDLRTLERCSMIVVDSRATAIRESGDLIVNGFSPEETAEMSDLLQGRVRRESERDITLFISHGLAVQDLYAAQSVLNGIQEAGSGEADVPPGHRPSEQAGRGAVG